MVTGSRLGFQGLRRGDEGNVPAVAGPERGQKALGQQVGPPQVDGVVAVELGHRGVLDRAAGIMPGGVNQNVEPRADSPCCALDRRLEREIARACMATLCCRLGEVPLVACDEEELGTLARERHRGRPADAAAGTGDERDPTRKRLRHRASTRCRNPPRDDGCGGHREKVEGCGCRSRVPARRRRRPTPVPTHNPVPAMTKAPRRSGRGAVGGGDAGR